MCSVLSVPDGGVLGVGFISEKLEESLSETLSLMMPVRFLPGFTGMTAVSSAEGAEKVAPVAVLLSLL